MSKETEWFTADYDVIDEIIIGTGCHFQLCENTKTKKRVIRSWASLQQKWTVMYRYGDMADIWKRWQKTAETVKQCKAEKKAKRSKK